MIRVFDFASNSNSIRAISKVKPTLPHTQNPIPYTQTLGDQLRQSLASLLPRGRNAGDDRFCRSVRNQLKRGEFSAHAPAGLQRELLAGPVPTSDVPGAGTSFGPTGKNQSPVGGGKLELIVVHTPGCATVYGYEPVCVRTGEFS